MGQGRELYGDDRFETARTGESPGEAAPTRTEVGDSIKAGGGEQDPLYGLPRAP